MWLRKEYLKETLQKKKNRKTEKNRYEIFIKIKDILKFQIKIKKEKERSMNYY